ncbi:MAG: hypothetical protein IAE67_11390 [Candidatus Competibacteraceae bacterium]|nr:hypothetical protein [Candidatus Competibacteraceae bacterium]
MNFISQNATIRNCPGGSDSWQRWVLRDESSGEGDGHEAGEAPQTLAPAAATTSVRPEIAA